MELFNILDTVSCNGINFDEKIPSLTSMIITIIQIAIPILLIIFGMLDLGKSVMAQKEDEIKAGQKTFMKRIMAAIIVFLVVVIVKVVIGLVVDKEEKDGIVGCISCFVSNECSTKVADKN